MPVKGELFPPIRNESLPRTRQDTQTQPTKKAVIKGGKLVISYPVVQEDKLTDESPLKRIATIDLATAAKQDKERRGNTPQKPLNMAPAVSQQSMADAYNQQVGKSLERKQVGGGPSARQTMASTLGPTEGQSSQGTSSSILAVPVTRNTSVRQRSPKHISQCFQEELPPVIPAKSASRSRSNTPTSADLSSAMPLQPPPRSPLRSLPRKNSIGDMLQEHVNSSKELLDQSKPSMEDAEHSAPVATSQPDSRVLPRRNESVSKSKSIVSPNKTVDVLVPPLAPLSPRKTRAPPQYELESNSGVQYRTTGALSSIPRSGSVKNNIRPSRQKLNSPPPIEEAKPLKTPVQLRGTTGLPNNPRARATAKPPAVANQDQTVMFINGINYNDPNGIQGIIDEISTDLAAKAGWEDSANRDSVVNRPRPIPRKSPVFPSVGSKELPKLPPKDGLVSPDKAAQSKPLILYSTAGSPSQLPPLPRPPPTPKSARLQPVAKKEPVSSSKADNAKIMERVTGEAGGNVVQPTSTSTALQPQMSPTTGRLSPGSKTNDPKAYLAAMPAMSKEDIKPPPSGKRNADAATKYVSKFSIATTMSPDEPPSAYLQSPALALLRSSQDGLKRRSSPVLPVNDSQESATPISIRVDQPFGGSASPASAQRYGDLQDAGANYASKSLNVPTSIVSMSTRSSYADSALLNGEDDGKEMVTFMLDRNTYYPDNAAATPPLNRIYGGTEGKRGSWHRRIGEHPPTFSDRESVQSRRVPRPPPLELARVTRRFKGPPPQISPLETPQQALDQIQQQLDKFDKLNADTDDNELEEHRMSLLADIEMEMGMEENRWQKMRDNLARASFSTVGSNPVSPFLNEDNSSPARNVQVSATEVNNNVANNNGTNLTVREKDMGRPRSSVLYTADQVQISRLNRLPARFQSTSANDPSEISTAVAQDGVSVSDRNTPPAAMLSSQDNMANPSDSTESNLIEKGDGLLENSDLWQPNSTEAGSETTNSQTSLWNSASESVIQPTISLPSGPRPVTRRAEDLPPVEDSGLWDKPGESSISQARTPSLWRAALQSPESSAPQEPATRPRTLKPPRKSRRISSLPDILENPEPMENKRGTLGIFQFPWGEKSDTASLPTLLQSQMVMGMPVNMVTGGPPIYPSLEMQMQVLRSQQQSSSFFDHYDDEDAILDVSEDSDNDSFYGDDDDDSFDETTLWEIASLLRSDRVPSRDSLFPGSGSGSGRFETLTAQGDTLPNMASSAPQAQEVVEEQDGESADEDSPRPLLRRESSSPTLPPPDATLWVNNVHIPAGIASHGLFQDDKLWATYIADEAGITRAPLRQSEVSKISSTSLWARPMSKIAMSPPVGLWSTKTESQHKAEPVVHVKEVSRSATPESTLLWSAPESTIVKNFGLPQPKSETWIDYKSLGETTSRRRPRKRDVLTIESQSLWSQSPIQEEPAAPRGIELKVEVVLPSSDDEDKEDEPSTTTPVNTMSFVQPVVDDTTSAVESPMKSSELEDAFIPIADEPAVYDATIATESEDDIVAASPLGNDLWVPITTMPMNEERHGLFQVNHSGNQQVKDYRGTAKSPAALETRPTPRSVRRSLPSLESQTLWAPPTRHSFAHDWVTLSSIRPSTPPGQLSSESGSESPFSDTSSTYSNVTGESTVASFLTAQASAQPKPQFVTDADWMATLQSTGPATRPRDEVVSSVPNWAAALHDSSDDVTPRASAYMLPTEPAEAQSDAESQPETMAEVEAEAQSETEAESPIPEQQTKPPSIWRQTQTGGFDPARHHPVFNVYTLDTSNGDCHPAAQGYIHTLVNHNPDLIQR